MTQPLESSIAMPTPSQLGVRAPEWMDQPDLDPDLHRQALDGLARLNWISCSAGILWKPIYQIARQCEPRPCRILDLASGGGDVARSIAARARRRGLLLEMEGVDRSEVAVAYANKHARGERLDNVHFRVGDALAIGQAESPRGYDIVMSSLFLHHLDEADAVRLLRKMSTLARRCVLVNDLRRTRLGPWWVAAACRLLTRSPVVHVDGPLSARAAYSAEQLRELALQAGLVGAQVRIQHPQRMLLVWSPT